MPEPLPRKSTARYGWRPDTPDFRDRALAPVAPTAQPPEWYVLPAVTPPVRDQGDQGSCTGHSVRSHAQALRALEKQVSQFELSPRFIYWNGRVIEGTTREDAGCEIRDVIKGAAKRGFCSETLCPYVPSTWTKQPTMAAFVAARLDMAIEYLRVPQTLFAMKAAILSGAGFVFGFSVYDNFEAPQMASTGILAMPTSDMSMLGGHAVWACGYNDTRHAFLIQNSWGKYWGCAHPLINSRGYFWMPYDYAVNPQLADDLWQIRKIS